MDSIENLNEKLNLVRSVIIDLDLNYYLPSAMKNIIEFFGL